ncbi:MAG: electron transfer flavoprotein subunit beta/FixA family protein [Proteobacteria bacterium]|nr:electron transfer flavoprotein subunit beta/FixA family protein [Pseudomonadota bacterium]
MLKMIVCIKQVPMVSELNWDPRTGTLKRDLAEGMMNPACHHALEAALRLKELHGGHITAITMGPPMAEEVLREALAIGADRCILLTDKRMAGADTFMTSFILARAIEKECPDFDIVLCGCHTSDSETAQVGPQLTEELKIPGAAYVEWLELKENVLRMKRLSDNFLETLEMDLPGLVTVTTSHYQPRYVPLAGLQDAYDKCDIITLDADDLKLKIAGIKDSPTRILKVYSPDSEKKNIEMKGPAKKIVEELLDKFGRKIGGEIQKDLKAYGQEQ